MILAVETRDEVKCLVTQERVFGGVCAEENTTPHPWSMMIDERWFNNAPCLEGKKSFENFSLLYMYNDTDSR